MDFLVHSDPLKGGTMHACDAGAVSIQLFVHEHIIVPGKFRALHRFLILLWIFKLCHNSFAFIIKIIEILLKQ